MTWNCKFRIERVEVGEVYFPWVWTRCWVVLVVVVVGT
jgi:hypothetical protein